MSTPFTSERAALVVRNWWGMALAALPSAVGVVLGAVGMALEHGQLLMLAPMLVVAGVWFAQGMGRGGAFARDRAGRVEAGEEGVTFEGAKLVGREEIEAGFVMPWREQGGVVRLQRKGRRRPIDVRLADREQGREMLRALGLSAAQTAATFKLPGNALEDSKKRSRAGSLLYLGIGMAIALSQVVAKKAGAMLPFVVAAAVLSVGAWLALRVLPTTLRVGVDGLHLSRLRTRRFIGYGEVASIRRHEDLAGGRGAMVGLLVTLHGGEEVWLGVQRKSDLSREQVAILEERIAEAVEVWRRGDSAADAATVRRAGRAPADWIRSLRSIASGANADARTAPVLPDRLWRIVEDPAAPSDARAGAAVALSLAADPTSRSRLRAAASATAAPRLRIALEAAANATTPDDDALTTALAEVDSADDPGTPPEKASLP